MTPAVWVLPPTLCWTMAACQQALPSCLVSEDWAEQQLDAAAVWLGCVHRPTIHPHTELRMC